MALIDIKDLHVSVSGTEILKGFNLSVSLGEVHSIMGPNGSGKSTLARTLAGHGDYEITAGQVEFNHKDLLELSPDQRAGEGLFLAFQYPVEIPGVSNMQFLRAAVNAVRRYNGQDEYDAMDFLKLVRQKLEDLHMDDAILKRNVNEGFSGGEKKRYEVLQMSLLEPKLCILDETDSGLDIDALKIVAKGVNNMRGPDRAIVVITHYQRLLDYVVPDFVHVLMDGQIIKSGGKELALELEDKGYAALKPPAQSAPAQSAAGG